MSFNHKLTIYLLISILLVSCSTSNKFSDKIAELPDRVKSKIFANQQLKYAGYELIWLDVEGKKNDSFKRDFEGALYENLRIRIPHYFKGERSTIIVITLSNLENPSGLELVPYQRPSILVKAVVQDASSGEALLSYEMTVVDEDTVSLSDGIIPAILHINNIPSRLAANTVTIIIGNVSGEFDKVKKIFF